MLLAALCDREYLGKSIRGLDKSGPII